MNISFLKGQVIQIYNISDSRLINTGIEGEDVSFAPGKNSFISLIYKKLFIVDLNSLVKKRIELKRSWISILKVYRDLINRKSEYSNEFSAHYVNRKIRVYSNLIKI